MSHKDSTRRPAQGLTEAEVALYRDTGVRQGTVTLRRGAPGAPAEPLSPLSPAARADRAKQIRVDAAHFQHSVPLTAHPDNGDEVRYGDQQAIYPQRLGSYSKGLPHDGAGNVDPDAYNELLEALASGAPANFEEIPLGGVRRLVNPQAAYAYALEGADPYALAIRPAPQLASPECAGEMEELYWMSLARDVPFQSYSASPPQIIVEAVARLNVLADFRGPRENGFVTSATLFRDGSAGSRKGPFISQFLLKDVPYGVQTISQRNKTRPAGDDRMCTSAEWLNIQDGQPPAQPEAFDPVRRYIRNGRDLAELVHHDVPLQAALNAALLIIAPGQGDDDTDPKAAPLVHDENNPYRLNGGYTQQEAFATFGNGDALDLIGRIVNLALRGAWAQKWLVHRRLRPEACGGGIHAQKTGAAYPMWTQMMQSPVLSWVYDRNNLLNGSSGGTYLLSQAYPGGSPLHPAYPSGHSTYIGAAVTMMKALFKDRAVVDPVQPDASGTSLVPYQGPTLYLFDELDKLASNIGLGRLFAGVHYRSDHEQAVRLGELIALRVLQDMTRLYNETFPGFMVRTFGGETLTITKNGPDLPNHVSAILGFTLINSLAEQPVASHDPLLNGSTFQGSSRTIRANTYPSNVGSVRFVHEHNGVQRVFTDSSAPYALAGDVNGNYHHVVFGSGEHVLTATPFSGAGASGISGVPLTIRFTVQA